MQIFKALPEAFYVLNIVSVATLSTLYLYAENRYSYGTIGFRRAFLSHCRLNYIPLSLQINYNL